MTADKKPRGGITATELMAKLQNDPEYQRETQAAEAERQVRVREVRRAEQPIVADLRKAGVQVDSVWDLVNTAEPYPAALPILIQHLERDGYPDRVMEGLGRALAVKPAVVFWDRLRALFLGSRNRGEEDGTAVALAACATEAQLDDLLSFLSVEERGESRIYFIGPILRVGGHRGREIVGALRSDPLFGKEATAMLSGHD
jgi:hypothetical protein